MSFCAVLVWALSVLPAHIAFAQEPLVVVLGDSNTEGYGVGAQAAFPARLEAVLRRSGRHVRVENAGVAGDTFAGMTGRVNASVPPGTNVVIVQGGYNDLQSGLPSTQIIENVRALLGAVRSRGVRTVVVCGFFSQEYDAMGRSAAAAYGAAFIPGRDCYDPPNAGADGLHMSAAGHQVVAARLAGVVQPMLYTGKEPRPREHSRLAGMVQPMLYTGKVTHLREHSAGSPWPFVSAGASAAIEKIERARSRQRDVLYLR
jgi:acyl-CoA thioesterase-1